MISSVLSTATTGLLKHTRDVHVSAERIVQQPVAQPDQTSGANDLSTEIVNMKRAEIGYSASATIIRTADDMSATLLNILA